MYDRYFIYISAEEIFLKIAHIVLNVVPNQIIQKRSYFQSVLEQKMLMRVDYK